MALNVQIFTASSGVVPHPSVQVNVPSQFKIIGGGALDHWSGAGNLLTASFPSGLHTWVAAGKDHEQSSPASITAFAVALFDPADEWDVIVISETSSVEPHPSATAVLPVGFTLTGGGAFVDWHGAGNLLTASFPNSDTSWEARSKDHDISDPAKITAFAIGVRHKSGVQLQRTTRKVTSGVVPHPSAQVCLDAGWTLTGGGAFDNWSGDGNLLTASYPQGSCWIASGKDHMHSDPASITAYVIGVKT
jgi:vibriolysin